VALDERSTKIAGRCERHPSAAVVAACADCDRALCIKCAVPIRGRILGPECLPAVLGPDLDHGIGAGHRSSLPLLGTGLAFALATLASALPWKRFGLGSGIFGAWGLVPRWSIVAGVAAVLGLSVWAVVALRHRAPGHRWMNTMLVLAVAVIAASVLHLIRPPAFGPSSFGPWVALLAGVLAVVGILRARSRDRDAEPLARG
jgi:hypothetical protein